MARSKSTLKRVPWPSLCFLAMHERQLAQLCLSVSVVGWTGSTSTKNRVITSPAPPSSVLFVLFRTRPTGLDTGRRSAPIMTRLARQTSDFYSKLLQIFFMGGSPALTRTVGEEPSGLLISFGCCVPGSLPTSNDMFPTRSFRRVITGRSCVSTTCV